MMLEYSWKGSSNKDPAIMLQEKLQSNIGRKLRLKINDNRSTMLSVKWEPAVTTVSLHRMFLGAPRNIMQDLTCYLKRKNRILSPSIKAFIEVNLQKLDYSHELDLSKLQTAGRVYDLKKIYDRLNKEYFNNSLKLRITWFEKERNQSRNRVVFGLYFDPLKLIKINSLLDSRTIPEYFIEYVIYHEMLHFVCPTFVDEKGQKHIHSKAFKERERKYKNYEIAQYWMKQHQQKLFK